MEYTKIELLNIGDILYNRRTEQEFRLIRAPAYGSIQLMNITTPDGLNSQQRVNWKLDKLINTLNELGWWERRCYPSKKEYELYKIY